MQPPGLVTPRGALRRSLVLWGWGQLATGDRRGIVLVALELLGLGAFAVAVPALLDGTLSVLLFLAGAAFVAAWGAIALHAYKRAVARRAPFVAPIAGLLASPVDTLVAANAASTTAEARGHLPAAPGDAPAGDGGAIELLWLAPVLIVTASAFWTLGGSLGSPESTLATYVRDWRDGYGAQAASLFVGGSLPGDLAGAWSRQRARLHNQLVPIAATSGTDSGIDPSQPLDSLRFIFDEARADAVDTRTVHVQTVRRETVRDTFFGLVPTTSQRVVTIADVGTISLALVHVAGVPGGTWRIASVDLLDEHLGP